MSTITFRTTDREKEHIKDLASYHGMTMSEYIKITMREKIEDELDYRIAEERLSEFESSGEDAFPFDDVLHELGTD